MRFFLYPFSGTVRDLHRFLLTRCAVVVLTGLGGLGGHFAEGDHVERADSESDALASAASSAQAPPDDASAYLLPAWALADEKPNVRSSVTRSARGESMPLEMARLDAPLSDVPFELAP